MFLEDLGENILKKRVIEDRERKRDLKYDFDYNIIFPSSITKFITLLYNFNTRYKETSDMNFSNILETIIKF